jgi:hypothetical protein
MQNDTKDRHVVAAAVKAGAQVITTANLKDFSPLPDGIEAQSPITRAARACLTSTTFTHVLPHQPFVPRASRDFVLSSLRT